MTVRGFGRIFAALMAGALGTMQFGVLVQVLFWRDGAGVAGGAGDGARVWAHLCEIDGRVRGGMQFGALVQVLFSTAVAGADGAGVWAHFCEIELTTILGCLCRALRGC